jgi:hypothetical protein
MAFKGFPAKRFQARSDICLSKLTAAPFRQAAFGQCEQLLPKSLKTAYVSHEALWSRHREWLIAALCSTL